MGFSHLFPLLQPEKCLSGLLFKGLQNVFSGEQTRKNMLLMQAPRTRGGHPAFRTETCGSRTGLPYGTHIITSHQGKENYASQTSRSDGRAAPNPPSLQQIEARFHGLSCSPDGQPPNCIFSLLHPEKCLSELLFKEVQTFSG